MANSSNISLRLNVENGDYMIVWGMYVVKHSGSEVSNCWLYLLMTWGYLIYKTGWITAQKCDVSICSQYFGMSGVRPWAWPRDGILSMNMITSFLKLLTNLENNGKDKIGLVIPTHVLLGLKMFHQCCAQNSKIRVTHIIHFATIDQLVQ